LADAVRQIDHVKRRLIRKEVIPHKEMAFSIHAPHTRWISKGKTGVKTELGLPVSYQEDQHQFILHHQVLPEGMDSDMIVPFVEEVQRRFPPWTPSAPTAATVAQQSGEAGQNVEGERSAEERGQVKGGPGAGIGPGLCGSASALSGF